METRANYIIVGLFTLIVLAASFIFIYWVAKIDDQVNTVPVKVNIRGAVTGLSAGSDVHFNGIKVGKVSRIVFNNEDPGLVSALIQVDETTPIRTDTKATISSNGLTGTALVALTGGGIEAPSLLQANEDGNLPEINATPSAISDIVETVRDVATKANRTLASIERLVEDNRNPITQTLQNAETFSQSLAKNSESIDKFLASTSNLGETISNLSNKLDGSIAGIEKIVEAVEPEKISTIVANADKTMANADKTMASIQSLLEDNKAPLNDALKNVQTFSETLSKNSGNIDQFLASTANLGTTITTLSTKLDGTISRIEKVIGAVEPEKVTTIVANAESFSNNLKNSGGQIDTLLASVDRISKDLEKFSSSLNGSLSKLDAVVAAVEPESVKSTVADITEAAKGARQMVADAQTVTQSLAARREDINKIVTDASEMTARLNASSERVDSVLVKLDGFLGSGDASGIMTDARSTLLEFRNVASNLNGRINQISGGLTQFTNTGLKDVQALVNETRRSVSRIERVINNIERDPSGFLFGKSGVKTYNGRPRR